MHLSSRLPIHLNPNPLSCALAERRTSGGPLHDLTTSNPTLCGFRYPNEALRAALGGPEVLRYTPDARGRQECRAAVAAWHGQGVTPEDVLLAASTSEAYGWLFKLLCDPGDDILVPSPSYPLFEWLSRLEGIRTRTIPSYYHERWHLDLEALELACHERTRAIIAVNPNNPTGHFLSRSEWSALTDLCARKGLCLIVDEVFADYGLELPSDALATALEDPEPPCPVFILSGLSKIAALPQVKLGWILARGTAKAWLEPLAFIADQYLSVSASVQAALPLIFQAAPDIQAQIRKRLRNNLALIDAALPAHPALARLTVEGGWSAILRRPALNSDSACTLRILEQGDTLIHPGHFFDLPGDGFLVLSLLTPEPTLQKGLEAALPLAAS